MLYVIKSADTDKYFTSFLRRTPIFSEDIAAVYPNYESAVRVVQEIHEAVGELAGQMTILKLEVKN